MKLQSLKAYGSHLRTQATRVRYMILAVLLTLSLSPLAEAMVPALGWGYSLGYGGQWVLNVNGTRNGDGWSFWFDPPANVINGQVTFQYDPSLITILPQYSGPAGVFSDNPASAPAVNANEYYGSFMVSSLPNARPGDVWNLIVGRNTVTLTFDLSANPVSLDPSAGPVNMYALSLETSVPVSGFRVNHTAAGQFYELGSLVDQSQTYMNCLAADGSTYNCGETTSVSTGFGLTSTPEPGSLLLLGSGVLVAGKLFRTRVMRSC